MNAAYDPIAPEYRKCKQQPWRTHIECHTMMELIGDVSGQTVLDLACGEGYYARLLASSGAASVTGVDISENMIRLARRQEEQVPLGIESFHRAARRRDRSDSFSPATRDRRSYQYKRSLYEVAICCLRDWTHWPSI